MYALDTGPKGLTTFSASELTQCEIDLLVHHEYQKSYIMWFGKKPFLNLVLNKFKIVSNVHQSP